MMALLSDTNKLHPINLMPVYYYTTALINSKYAITLQCQQGAWGVDKTVIYFSHFLVP